jgi:single-stranded DNA-binding protein
MGGIAHCTVIGIVGRYGVEVKYATSGTPCAALTIVVSEQGQDGKVHELYVPIEVWGRRAEQAGELAPGQWVLFEGKLSRRKIRRDMGNHCVRL